MALCHALSFYNALVNLQTLTSCHLLLTIGQIKWNQINNAVVGKWVKPLTVQCVDNQTTKKGRGGEREEVRVKTQLRNRGQIQGKRV